MVRRRRRVVVVVVPRDLRYHHRDISNIDHLRIARRRSSSVVVRALASSSINPPIVSPPRARTRLAFDFAHDARVVRGHVHITMRPHRCVIVRAFVRPGCVVHVSRHHASTHDVGSRVELWRRAERRRRRLMLAPIEPRRRRRRRRACVMHPSFARRMMYIYTYTIPYATHRRRRHRRPRPSTHPSSSSSSNSHPARRGPPRTVARAAMVDNARIPDAPHRMSDPPPRSVCCQARARVPAYPRTDSDP